MENTNIINANIEEVVEKPYRLKKLGSENLFSFCTILNKIGFKEIKAVLDMDKIKALVQSEENEEKDREAVIDSVGYEIGMDIAGIVIANLENCKDAIYQLLSNLSGMTRKELENLDIAVFVTMIIDVFRKEEFKDFFKAVAKLIK